MQRYAISEIPLVNRALKSRWPQWLATALMLAFFVLAILAGLFGTPAGNRNFGIVFVWIVWWALLMLLLVPVFGRLWCGICPIPAPGEWLQRRSLVAPRNGGKLYTLGKKWPARFRNIWLQNVGFLGVALFSTVILTTPLVTALVLLGFVLVAIATSLVFERRTFCRYLCPVGGFIGLYSQVAPVELRVKDRDVCASHREKSCYTGSDGRLRLPVARLPWQPHLQHLLRALHRVSEDLHAGQRSHLCSDAGQRPRHASEAAGSMNRSKASSCSRARFIYSAVLIGPWGVLKDAARAPFTLPWLGYAAAFLLLNLVFVPGLFWLAVRASERIGRGGGRPAPAKDATKRFAEYATALVPLGLAAWIAFSLAFVTINFSYAWPSLSDPFGWGWNLFGTAGLPWTPYLSGVVPALQTPVLLAGMAWAIALALRTAHGHGRPASAALPVVAFCVLATLGLLSLYLA